VLAFPTYALTLGSLALTWAWVGLEPLLAGRFHAAEPVRRATSRPNARLVVAGASLVVATTILLWYGTLRRGAFSFWRERFEALARTAVVTTDAVGPTGKGEWIGPWYVDAIAADARGGVYLRTWRGFDFIDVLSYGFAYRPNLKGSPFGAAKYWLHRISGDWWIFRASSDWF
jgi:hypothetical protein